MRQIEITVGDRAPFLLDAQRERRLFVAPLGASFSARFSTRAGTTALTLKRLAPGSAATIDEEEESTFGPFDAAGLYTFLIDDDARRPESFDVLVPAASAWTDPRIREPRRIVRPEGVTPDPNPRSAEAIRAALQGFALDTLLRGRDLASTFDGATEIPSGVDWLRWLPADGR